MGTSPGTQRALLFVPFLREIRYASMREFPERMILTSHKLLYQKQRVLDLSIRSSDTRSSISHLRYPGTSFSKLYGICFLKIKLTGGRFALEKVLIGSFDAGAFLLWSVLPCAYKILQFFDKYKMEFYTNSRNCIW